MIINLKEIIGEFCSHRESTANQKGGDYIFDLIKTSWDKDDKIEISFDGVKIATPSFLDEAIGKLTFIYDLMQLRDKLKFSHLDEKMKNKINKSVQLRLKQKESNSLQQ